MNHQVHKPRILVVENGLDVTGGVNSIVRSSVRLKEAFEFIFVIPSSSKLTSHLHQRDFDVHRLPMIELKRNFLTLLLYFPTVIINAIRFGRLVKELQIDIIHGNDFYNLLPPVYKLFGGKVPYICSVRFRPSKFPSPLVQLWCFLHNRFASSIIAVSNAVKKELPYHQKVVVVGNELPLENDEPYVKALSHLILYPANFTRGKGHEYAIESFSKISHQFPQWKLRFVGGDMGLKKNQEFREELKKQADVLGISDRIEWLGFVPEMVAQYRAASIVLNFSESESFSLTCLESLFYGRAVIATDCGGPSEIIDHDISGLIVPVGDIERMSEAMTTLMDNPERREGLAARGYELVRSKFSNEKITESLYKIYTGALNN